MTAREAFISVRNDLTKARVAEPVMETVAVAEPTPEPEPMRVDPQLRLEPTFARPAARSFAEPDMNALGKAVADIAETTVAAAPQPAHRPQPAAVREEPRKGGLFDRFMSRRPATKDETPAPAAPPAAAPQPRMAATQPAAPRGGEDYDIPAFLRRQAN